MTESVNPKLEEAQGIFKDLIWDNLIDKALAALFAAVPWMNAPVLRDIIKWFVKLFTEYFYSNLKLTVDVTAISILNDQHKAAYSSAALKLKLVAHSYGIDSEQFKKERENAKKALSQFGQYNR